MEERTRLAHELHDSLAQTLASIRIQIRILDETLHQQDESAVWNHLETGESSVDEAYGELRELIARFRAPIDEHGLVPSIEKIVQRFKKESGILTFFHNDLVDTDLPENMELQVVRIVQEALNNARKHSDANAVRVMIRHENDEYRVLIEDDGIGFGTPAANGRPGEHLGLTIMRERAERIGGKLKIESDPNEGTRIHLVFRHPPDDDADGAKKTRAAS
jgi:two-component system nitrate/nitrite sensor histidine kinase NarX